MKCRIPNYNKVPISNNMMKRNIQRILESHQMSQECTNAVIRIYDFMIEKTTLVVVMLCLLRYMWRCPSLACRLNCALENVNFRERHRLTILG